LYGFGGAGKQPVNSLTTFALFVDKAPNSGQKNLVSKSKIALSLRSYLDH
jgi:hypothetical protein